MKLILLIYVLFATVNGVMIAEGCKGRSKWDVAGVITLLALNAIATWFAVTWARTSKTTGDGYKHGLSPGGWGFGFSFAYVVGFVSGIFVA